MNKNQFFKFNLNNKIKVKLTESGYHWLVNWYNESTKGLKNCRLYTTKYFIDITDKDGFMEFHAWEFIQIFGNITKIGISNYYETSILIKREDLGEVGVLS